MTEFKSLPTELALNILSYCDLQMLKNIRLVNHACYILSQDAFVSRATLFVALDPQIGYPLDRVLQTSWGHKLQAIRFTDPYLASIKLIQGDGHLDQEFDYMEDMPCGPTYERARQCIEDHARDFWPTIDKPDHFRTTLNQLTNLEEIRICSCPVQFEIRETGVYIMPMDQARAAAPIAGTSLDSCTFSQCLGQHNEALRRPVYPLLALSPVPNLAPRCCSSLRRLNLELTHSKTAQAILSCGQLAFFIKRCSNLQELCLKAKDECSRLTSLPVYLTLMPLTLGSPPSTLTKLDIVDLCATREIDLSLRVLIRLLEANRATLEHLRFWWRQVVWVPEAIEVYKLLKSCPRLEVLEAGFWYREDIPCHRGFAKYNKKEIDQELTAELERLEDLGFAV